MNTPKMTVETTTVSTMFETHRNGERTQHFVSATVRMDPSVDIEEWPLHQLTAAYKVSVAAVHDALMRGAVTVEDANERIKTYANNYEAMRAKLEKKVQPQLNGAAAGV